MIENSGTFGMGVQKGAEYRFSVWARLAEGEAPVKLRVEMCDPYGNDELQFFALKYINVDSKDWKKYEVVLKSTKTLQKASLLPIQEGFR